MHHRCRLLSMSAILMGSIAVLGTAEIAQARITKIVITTKTSPAFNGQTFGTVGQYEQLDGVAYGEVDPHDRQNGIIQDIELAPRNANGKVEYSMDISILKPIDMSKGSRVLLYDVVNRGNKVATNSFNVGATTANPAGDAFLQNQGITVVWSGWQADLVPAAGRIAMTVPVAKGRHGKTITGVVRSEISMQTATIQTSPIGGGFTTASRGYAPVSTDTTKATLTQRVREGDAREAIPSNQWAFGSCNPTFPSVTPDPDNTAQFHLCKQGGFDPNHIYELVYEGKDPSVLGLGFASTRDFVSFLRYSNDTQNPLYGGVEHTLLFGSSQSGRYARTLVHLGFNRDERSRIVLDGILPHIASARIAMNIRFGQPGRVAGLQHTERSYPGSESPVTWGEYYDPLARTGGSELDRCRDTRTCPKIVQTVTDTEYWQSMMASNTTDAFGRYDIYRPDRPNHFWQASYWDDDDKRGGHDDDWRRGKHDDDRGRLPGNVRIYHLASTQHGGFSPVNALPTTPSTACQLLSNANSYTYNLRALLVALKDWVVTGKEPPASRYPRIDRGTLVSVEQVKFPTIPGVNAVLSNMLNTRSLYYRGRDFDGYDVSGVETVQPPKTFANYKTLAPQVDKDGNDIDGVKSLTLLAPLGTHTGWNPRKAGFGEGDACDLTGSWIPFPKTAAVAGADPRTPIATRYPSTAAYDAAVDAAAQTLVQQGLLLASDQANAVAQLKTQAHNSGLLPP